MDSERYRLAKTIFFEACERPRSERDEFVQNMCAGNEPLRQAVLELLAHDDDPLTLGQVASFREHLEHLADSSENEASEIGAGSDGALPQRIGRYRVLRILGRGGMGVVYLAEQENPRRQVALKVIAPGQASRNMLRRFEHEAQILGRLHHPGIAQIYEAGTHDAGLGAQPYFAMELIHGRPLLKFSKEAHAGLEARLELFIGICEAVQHAHQQGVIHRDLKPANIMVVGPHGLETSLLQSKVLDFGVARLTNSDVQASTMHTAADQIIGTVAYMSPEQLSGHSDEVDTRSDVYALGVILFELLSGRLPHDVAGKTMPESIRIVAQEEPTALSSLNRAYRGDLDTIVGRALERDKARRYQSAGELAADVRRHLDDHPIHARPPSSIYQLRKFAQRNRALVAGAAAVLLMLILGIIGTTWQARRAIAARDEQIKLRAAADDSAKQAKVSAEKAMAVNAFLRSMLSSAQPEAAQGRDVMVSEVLDAAAREIDTLESLQPDVEAMIRMTIGETYLAIGRVQDAQVHLQKALILSRQVHGEPSADVAMNLALLASAKENEGDWQSAITLAEQALDMFRSVYQDDHADIAFALGNLAQYRRNRAEAAVAISLMRESLEMLRRLYGDEHLQVAIAQSRLADMLHNPAEAEPLLREAVATLHARLGERHPTYIRRLGQYAGLLMMRREFEQAESLLKKSIDLALAVYEPNHPDLFSMLMNLSFCYRLSGQFEKHISLCDRIVEMTIISVGRDNMRTAEALMDRADARGQAGDSDGYLGDYRAALEIARRTGQQKDVRACSARLSIAMELLHRRQDVAEAESLCREVLQDNESAPPETHWMSGQALILLGEVALQRQAFTDAEPLMLQGFERLGTSRLTTPRRRDAVERLVRLYESWDAASPGTGKSEHAMNWRSRLAEFAPRAPTASTVPAGGAPSGG